jgi:hypothetical protein
LEGEDKGQVFHVNAIMEVTTDKKRTLPYYLTDKEEFTPRKSRQRLEKQRMVAEGTLVPEGLTREE